MLGVKTTRFVATNPRLLMVFAQAIAFAVSLLPVSCTHDIDLRRLGPFITAIDGTGAEQPIAPRPEDVASWGAREGEREEASHRIDSAEPVLVVTGHNLEGVTTARAEGMDGQGIIDFDIEEATMTEVRLRFPAALAISRGGLFLLVVSTPLGDAEAQVFFLQGQDGRSELSCDDDTCTLDQDLVVRGDISATNATFEALELDELTVQASIWLPECPRGYLRDESRTDIVLCTDGRDEIVKVGDFWVDRYEASVWTLADCTGTRYGESGNWETVSSTFPYHGSFTEPLFACSVPGVTPSRYLTWFQAQSACAASGKRLMTSAEWQAAVAGTVDPGASAGGRNACLTEGTGPRATGGGSSCVSFWGAEDMIGNLWEWVEDWYGQGEDFDHDVQPAEYFGDGYLSVDAAHLQGDYETSFPAAGIRGGAWESGLSAGAFTLGLHVAPSYTEETVGFRCARGW